MKLNTRNNKLINLFQDNLEICYGFKPNSIYSYSYDLKKFQNYLEKNKEKSFLNVDQKDLIDYFLYLKKIEKISNNSISRVYRSINKFYSILLNEKKIIINPMLGIKPISFNSPLRDYFTYKEIEKFFKVFDNKTIYEIRDIALFELCYSSGLKVSEVSNLKIYDIDLKNNLICIKNNELERYVPIGDLSKKYITKYIREVRDLLNNDYKNDFLFVSNKKSKLDRKSIWRLFNKYWKRTEIQKKGNPTMLRHSFVIHLLDNDLDLNFIQELLGHSTKSSIRLYIKNKKEKNKNG